MNSTMTSKRAAVTETLATFRMFTNMRPLTRMGANMDFESRALNTRNNAISITIHDKGDLFPFSRMCLSYALLIVSSHHAPLFYTF